MSKAKVFRKQTGDASLRRMFSYGCHFRAGVPNSNISKSIRNRCVKAEGLSEP